MNSCLSVLQLMLLVVMLRTRVDSTSQPKSDCPTSCGDIAIPFPFGTGSDCHLDESFLINCNRSYSPPKPYLNHGEIEVIDISLDGQLRIAGSVASDCYDKSGSQVNGSISELILSKFHISSTRNKFTAVGCDTYALIEGSGEWKRMSAGCVSLCHTIDSVVNGSCSGLGCCQSSIPKGLKDFVIDIQSLHNHSAVRSFNPCGYAFVVEAGAFKFSSLDLQDLLGRKFVPVMLDWSIGNETCQVAKKNLSTYACRAEHSECSDPSSGVGYLCNCSTGFQGNPYLVDGCLDIDECISRPCEGTCTNLLGSYLCHSKDHTKLSTLMYIASVIIFPAVGSSWIFWRKRKMKVIKLREKLFVESGGLILQDVLSRKGRRQVIFTADDLKKATDNYNESRIICHDSNNKPVFLGNICEDGRDVRVTVKRCAQEIEPSQVDIFINTLIVRFEIDHVNLVNLIGCCLETQVPLLVYEYFSGKTLQDSIHDEESFLSWKHRLKIALKTAGALAYLHSVSGIPHVHGDITSANILLRSDYSVKVGPPSLDPEWILLRKLTERSDVYSFGVVLAELLTGSMAWNDDRPEGQENLARYFVSAVRQGSLHEILVRRLVEEVKTEQLKKVVALTERCLRMPSEDRPTMTQVLMELQDIELNQDSEEPDSYSSWS